jgi:Ca2+-dependent lipid-binding protein
MDLNEGILTLKVLEGKLSRDTEMFGAMSPYCTITFGKTKFKTKVHDHAGKLPKWTDEFQLEVTSPTDEMTLRVWD